MPTSTPLTLNKKDEKFIIETLDYLLHKDIPEDKQERIAEIVNSLRTKVQLSETMGGMI